MTNASNSTGTDSVVPDLMRVYESMTGGVAVASESSVPYTSKPDVPPPVFLDSTATTTPAAAAPDRASSASPSDAQWEPSSENGSPSGRARRKRKAHQSQSQNSSEESVSEDAPSNQRSSKVRRKKDQDGRWSKRFTWPEALHRDFVSSIFDVGLKHSSPSTILEHMPPHPQITSERVKSHLQKYRLHRARSKKEFLSCYDATMGKLKKTATISGGQVAGHVAYATMHAPEENADSKATGNVEQQEQDSKVAAPGKQPPQAEQEAAKPPPQDDSLVFPQLTEEEKKSPVGASMGYLMGLFLTLKQQLKLQREAAAAKKNNLADLYHSFVHEPPLSSLNPSAVSAAAAAANPGQPSTRLDLEENTMMKREMQYQMAFQNKMRALKRQEVEKYNKARQQEQQQQQREQQQQEQQHGMMDDANVKTEDSFEAESIEYAQQQQQQQQQATGEHDPAVRRERSVSIGMPGDDFWNNDAVDDQLFEFLMST